MFVEVELPVFSGVEAELPDELGIAEDQEGFAAEVGEICSLIWILLDHVLHEALGVCELANVVLLEAEHAGEGSDVKLEGGVHLFELPSDEVDLDD